MAPCDDECRGVYWTAQERVHSAAAMLRVVERPANGPMVLPLPGGGRGRVAASGVAWARHYVDSYLVVAVLP